MQSEVDGTLETASRIGRRERIHQIYALVVNEARIFMAAPLNAVFLTAMAVVMVIFLEPLSTLSLNSRGFADKGGAKEAVPGMALFFALFMTRSVGFAFIIEHIYGTWDRLMTVFIPSEVVIAKSVVPFLYIVFHFGAVFIFGSLVFGEIFPLKFFVLAAVLAVSFAFFVVSLGICIASWVRNPQQLDIMSTLAALVLAGAGGAAVPVVDEPSSHGLNEAMQLLNPVFWGMEGYRALTLGTDPSISTTKSVIAILTSAVVLLLLSRRRSYDRGLEHLKF